MKQRDIEQLYEARLISDEQRRQIIGHFNLDQSRNWFLTILVGFGGVLALMGVILVISANWDEIPGLLKILCGGALMAGAHLAGWHCRGTRQTSPRLGETFHFLGAGLFLANIALISQVYHLSSRAPNGFILWLAGIIPLAWVLRARSIHILSVLGLITWMGMEINAHDGWLHFAEGSAQATLFAALGVLLYGAGQGLGRSSYRDFAPVTERLGLILLHLSLWLTLPGIRFGVGPNPSIVGIGAALAVPGLLAAAICLQRENANASQWWKGWTGVLAGWVVMVLAWPMTSFDRYETGYGHYVSTYQMIASVALVAGCLVQIRAAIDARAGWMVNLAIVTIGYTLIVDFLLLIGNMMNTGLIFLVGGVGLLALGYVLERKRRAALRQIRI